MTTILRARVAHTPRDPFDREDALETFDDGAVAFEGETIVATGDFAVVRRRFADAEVLDRRDCILLPGFVDTHVHFPQIAVIGAMGLQLLDWLAQRTLPEEARMADAAHARRTAERFVRALAHNGTTSALVFGAHFPDAQEALFEAAERRGLRIASGLVVSDRNLRPDLEVTPDAGVRALARVARALARPRTVALRRHAALLGVLHRGDARRLPRAARRGRAVHEPRQREPGRDRRSCASCSRRRATTSTRTNGPGCWASARCSRTTCTSPTTSSAAWRRRGRRSRIARRQQRLPGLGDLPDGAPRRARRVLRDGHRRRRGHRPEHAQGGPRRLPRPDGPRPGPHARPGAPAVAGDGGGSARDRARRRRAGTCSRARRPTSCCCDRAPGRRWRRCWRRRRTGTRRSARVFTLAREETVLETRVGGEVVFARDEP